MKTLEEIELFNEYTIMNVPSFLFIASLLTCVFSFFISIVGGFVFSCALVPSVIYFHKDDPHALSIFIKSFSKNPT